MECDRLPSFREQAGGPKIEAGDNVLSGAATQTFEQIQNLESIRSILGILYTAIDHYISGSKPTGLGIAAANQNGCKLKTTAELVDELLVVKRQDGLSERYLQTLRSHLNRFAKAFSAETASLTCRDIESWLRQLEVGPRARNNMRGSIVTFFRFARKQGYLPKGQPTEADEITKAKDLGGGTGILKPDELEYVLHRAPKKIALFLALGAFTGMRSSEILRLEWHEVNFEREFITVAAEKAKTATRRLVPILGNLRAWLDPYRGKTGRLFLTRRDADRAIAFAKKCGIKWPNNALRHSYATYRLAAIADAARVALEMGNSPQKLIRNYRELADRKEADAWFSILPSTIRLLDAVG